MGNATDIIVKPKYVKLNKQRLAFISNWLDPTSKTWGNAYQSAIEAGFSPHYARVITTDFKNIEWVQQAKNVLKQFTPMHIIQGFQHEAVQAQASRDRQNALDKLAKINGLYIERSQSEINVNFTNNVPRPIIDVSQADSAHN